MLPSNIWVLTAALCTLWPSRDTGSLCKLCVDMHDFICLQDGVTRTGKFIVGKRPG